MRAVLDKKVQGMRSQVMSFANDGVEVSLSIPDTNDVKEAFGSMIDTVAEQHDEIGKLNTNLDTSNQENKQSRRKLVDATNQKLQTLMHHNLELQKQLHYAQRKMRNFSYNVQGFLDPEDQEESSFSTIVDANSLKSVTITLQEVETQDTPPSLFPTEEGANPNRDLVVQRIDSADTSRKIKKKINKYIKIGEKIVEYQNIPDWTCPKDVLARWFWAYRKILQRVRRKDMKIGFSATRIQQHQTISGKLDLIDNELFHLSSSTSTKFDRLKKDLFEQINQQSEKFNQKIDDVYHQQEQLKENHNRRLDDLTVALSSFQNETNEVIQLLKAQQSTNLQTLMEDVERLKARLNFQEDFYLRMKNEELERYQQQTSTLVEESLSLGQSLSLILQCKRNDPIDAFPAKSLYSEVQLTSEYLSDYHCLLDTLKQVFQKDQEVKLIRDSAIALQAKSMYLDRSLVNMEAELTAIQQRSKTHPQESMNHSSFASVAIAVIPTFRDRLKEFEGNLNWTTRGISHHESVLFSLLDRLLNHSEKAFDDFQRQQGQSHVLKDRFDHLTRSFETLETKNTNLITTIYKVENDIVDLNRQCYVLNNYNKRKISVDLLADDIEGLKAQLVGLKGDISHAQYHYDDSVCDNQSQISNPDPFHFEDDHPVETVEAESEVKEEMINSPPLEEPNLERNSVETSEDCTGLDQLLENEITDSIEEKKDGKPSSSHRKNSSLPREKDNKDAKSRPSTGNGENDEIIATTSQRKGEHQRSAKGRRKSTQEKQKSTPPKEQLESLISKICSEQLQNAMREYMSHSPAVITQIGFNHQPNQTTNTQPSSQNRIKDSIAKAIQQAEVYENDEQPVTTTISTEDSLLFKKKRKPNSALMGSFIDYDTRKSFPSSTGAEPPTTTISVRLKSPSSENGHITTNSYNNILGIPTTTSFDPSPIIGDISTLKEEIGGLRHFVTSVNDDKITREEVKDLFFDLFRDQRKRDIKQENNRTQYLDELQKSLQDLNREFTNMKSNQDSFAHQLKVDVDGIMNKLLVKISHEVSESQKDSVFSTKGLCLGCGRVSNVRTQPSSRATSPPFLPALNNHITPGPEIYRGGFRMLGHSNSPQLNQASQLTAQSFPLDGESSLLQQSHVGKEVPLLLRNKVMTLPEAQQREQHPYKDFRKDFESFNPTVVSLATPSMLNSNVDGSSIMTEDLNQRKIPENEKETSNAELHLTMPALQYSDQINFDFDADSIKSPHKEKDLQFGDSASIPDGAFEGLQSSSTLNAPASFVPPVIVRSMPSHDSSSLRPIFRKGFPAKKSLKAETTFAPERFDLAASVRAGSASIAVRSNQSSTGKVTGNPLLSKSVSNGK